MYIGFFDDEVVSDQGSVLCADVNEVVEQVIDLQEAIGRHRDTIDWDLLTVYEIGDLVKIDDIRNYLPEIGFVTAHNFIPVRYIITQEYSNGEWRNIEAHNNPHYY